MELGFAESVADSLHRVEVGPAFLAESRAHACDEGNDAVRLLAEQLPVRQRAVIEAEVEAEVATAFAFAAASPFPGTADLTTDIYKEDGNVVAPHAA